MELSTLTGIHKEISLHCKWAMKGWKEAYRNQRWYALTLMLSGLPKSSKSYGKTRERYADNLISNPEYKKNFLNRL